MDERKQKVSEREEDSTYVENKLTGSYSRVKNSCFLQLE